MTHPEKNLHSWRESLRVYLQPRSLIMLLLGFSAGLPFLLVFSTLSAWLTEANIARSTIGFFSWIGIMYSIKVLWAPLVDRTPLPLLGKIFGQRRSWLLLAQCGIGGGLILLSLSDPQRDLQFFALCALLVAFSSATQDVAIDAYRIESAEKEYQAALSATYILGYRVATLAAGAGALYLADFHNWTIAYQVMAALTLLGAITTLLMREPAHIISNNTQQQEIQLAHQISNTLHVHGATEKVSAWFTTSFVSPFTEFFHRQGNIAIVVLVLIGSYRITDITMAVMANPFYLDLGFSKSDIASISKLFGFFLTIFGAISGGVLVMHYGIMRIMLLGLILVVSSNLLFAWLAQHEPDITALAMVISADSFAGGVATAVFVAYLSSLTNTAYTATQYALFSSLMTLFPKIIAGFSGIIVEQHGYVAFYWYSSLLSIPAFLALIYLLRRHTDNT